jgi:cell wall-associated NlpC family hydrolase
MSFRKLVPPVLLLAACFTLGLLTTTAAAQTEITRPRQVTASTVFDASGIARLETDAVVVSKVETEREASHANATSKALVLSQFNQHLLTEIDARLGAPYVYGSSGPHVFDCSGFVWSVFQSSGIRFDRQSARALWTLFPTATEDEEIQFGTLVFFSGRTHIGIVSDEHGFYHASRSHGVVYSTFNDYWLSRVDGFRRVPVTETLAYAK